MKFLIDADILIFKAGTCYAGDLERAKVNFIGRLDQLKEDLNYSDESDSILLACTGKTSFRKELYPKYKSHRPPTPETVKELKQWVIETMGGMIADNCEADDILGMSQSDDSIIVTEDKDLMQIPGRHYNWTTKTHYVVSPEQGLRSFYTQVLSGDPSDGYPGCPRIGKEIARSIIEATKVEKLWLTVLGAYGISELTKEDALVQARMAYILHPEDSPDYRWVPPLNSTEGAPIETA